MTKEANIEQEEMVQWGREELGGRTVSSLFQLENRWQVMFSPGLKDNITAYQKLREDHLPVSLQKERLGVQEKSKNKYKATEGPRYKNIAHQQMLNNIWHGQ